MAMTKNEKQLKHAHPVQVVTTFKSTDVIVGGTVFLTAEDCRGILRLTDTEIYPDVDDIIIDKELPGDIKATPEGLELITTQELGYLYQCSDILETIAKGILHTSGKATNGKDLLAKLTHIPE